MRKQDIRQMLLFAVFFGIGTAAVSISILAGELLKYHQGRELLKKNEIYLQKLEKLNADYDVLLKQLHSDPDAVKRLAPATLGTEPEDNKKTIYPKMTAAQLNAAKKVLMENHVRETKLPEENNWITRCSKFPRRVLLLLAGGGLIIVSLVYFGPGAGKELEIN
jgi:hypothetical protein